jgi:hypothetical protein
MTIPKKANRSTRTASEAAKHAKATIAGMRETQKALAGSVQRLRTERNRLDQEVRDRNTYNQEAKNWHSTDVRLQLIASGEPGFVTVTCQFVTSRGCFVRTQDFHIANICQALPYMAPATMQAWREMLAFANDILDKAINTHRQCS